MSTARIKTVKTNTADLIKLLIALVTVAVIVWMFPRHQTIETDYSVGMIWSKEDLIAPYSFPIYKSENVYQKELEEARSRVFPVFDVNAKKKEGNINWLDSLNRLFISLSRITEYMTLMKKESLLPEEKRTTGELHLEKLKSELPLTFTQAQWEALLNTLNSRSESEAFKKKIIQVLNEVYEKKIIDLPKTQLNAPKISVFVNRIEETLDSSDVMDLNQVNSIINSQFSSYFKNPEIVIAAERIALRYVYPDFIYNQQETEKVLTSVSESVPRTIGIVRENERIISKHEPINELTRLKIESYNKIRSEQMGNRDYYLQLAGRAIFVSAMIFLIGIFLYKMRYEIFRDNRKLILLSTIIVMQCLFSYVTMNMKTDYPVEYLIFVPVAAMLLTIIFDSRLAVYVIIITCILVSAIRGGDYDILIPNFTASLLVIYSVRDIKNRSQIFTSMIYIFAGYLVSIVALGFERYDNFNTIKSQLFMASLNSLLSPIFVYGLLIFYEKAFWIATDLVFLELSDFNHPLLRELSAKAPGTFHHSIVVGNLAEQAAKEIGANQILARVGCYYHDIGKIYNPSFFVENQIDSNRHSDLNPSLSAKMIIAHVKNGIKLAEKYRLPKEIIDFIPMHHGTNLVSYFYDKARTEEGEMDTTHDYIYRYPGPKPQTKETGIAMLADAVEAATRSIEEPTPAKLETQITEIIKARFLDGELDECNLTLKDLIKIKQSFLKTLLGIHHQRIKYHEDGENQGT